MYMSRDELLCLELLAELRTQGAQSWTFMTVDSSVLLEHAIAVDILDRPMTHYRTVTDCVVVDVIAREPPTATWI